MAFQAIPSKWLFSLAAHATAYTTIFGAFAGLLLFFRADLPPFASMSRAEEIVTSVNNAVITLRGRIDDVEKSKAAVDARQDQRDDQMTLALLDIQIFNWEERLRRAKEDRRLNPASDSAIEAEAAATEKLKKLRKLKSKLEKDDEP